MKKIGELLVQQGKISERDVERTLLAQTEMGGVFGQVLVKLGLVSEADGRWPAVVDRPADGGGLPGITDPLEALSQDFLLSNAVVPVADSPEQACSRPPCRRIRFLAKALAMALDKPVAFPSGLKAISTGRCSFTCRNRRTIRASHRETTSLAASQTMNSLNTSGSRQRGPGYSPGQPVDSPGGGYGASDIRHRAF